MRKQDYTRELKKLETEQKLILKELSEQEGLIKKAESSIHQLTINLGDVREQIDKLKKSQIIVTEHAILRYLERIEGLDVESIKEQVLPQDIFEQAATLGDGIFPAKTPSGENYRVVVKNRTVVTVEV